MSKLGEKSPQRVRKRSDSARGVAPLIRQSKGDQIGVCPSLRFLDERRANATGDARLLFCLRSPERSAASITVSNGQLYDEAVAPDWTSNVE
jgi:hypothetical protein